MKKFLPLALLTMLACEAAAGQDAGSPRMNYMLHCSGCHGQDGSGSPSSGVPSMRGTLGHFLKVKDGREFLIQVPGTSQSPLSSAATAELANWMLTKFSPLEVPANTVPYNAEEVSGLRGRPLADAPGRRSEIVQRLKAQGIVID